MIALLAALFGTSAYLTVHHLLVWVRNREESAYLWVGLWSAGSCAYQVSRYSQIIAQADEAAMAQADDLAFTTAVLVLMVLVMTFRAISDVPEPRWAPAVLVSIGIVTLALHATTHLFIARGVGTYESLLGGEIRFTRVGPFYLPLLMGYSGLAYAYGMWTVYRSTRLERSEKIAFAIGVQAYAALGMNDVLLFTGFVQTFSVFEYGFAAFAVGLSLLLQRRIERLQNQLESEVARATKSLRAALEEANAAARAKSQFLANMSHEIRTPLNGVLGTTKLLLDHTLDAHTRESVEIIDRCGDSLLTLVNDVLDFSKLDQGAMMLSSLPVDIGSLADDTAALFRAQAEAKGIALHAKIAPEAREPVLGDPTRIVQVFRNLVGNAVKFTDAGSVTLRVEANDRDAHRALSVEVVDTGIGIPAGAQAALFQQFAQVDGSSTRAHGGTGLGLAISKRIVEAMVGTISLTSAEGRGTTVRVEFTLPKSSRSELVARTGPPTPSVVNGSLRVLVVEDYPLNQRVARGFLERLGCEVTLAHDGQNALDILETERFDCVFMDCQMPILDGFEATRRFRALEEAQARPRTRIVALTANVMPEDRRRCLESGMDDYVPKPLDAATLERALRASARRSASTAPARGAEPSIAPPGEPLAPAVLDLEQIRELEELTSSFDEIFAEMIHDTTTRLAEIERAFEARAFDSLRMLAHTGKGAAVTVGAPRLGAAHAELEAAARAGDQARLVIGLTKLRRTAEETKACFAARGRPT